MIRRLALTTTLALGLCSAASAQVAPEPAATAASTDSYPAVTFGVLSYLQYSADLHEADGYNAFDVTRGFLDIRARLSPRVRFRFTPDVRPTTDADLSTNLALRLAYASLEADITKGTSVVFGMHDTPWLSFEQSIDRYRVQGEYDGVRGEAACLVGYVNAESRDDPPQAHFPQCSESCCREFSDTEWHLSPRENVPLMTVCNAEPADCFCAVESKAACPNSALGAIWRKDLSTAPDDKVVSFRCAGTPQLLQ